MNEQLISEVRELVTESREAGARGRSAQPMHPSRRLDNYVIQNGGRPLTPRQLRRYRRKAPR